MSTCLSVHWDKKLFVVAVMILTVSHLKLIFFSTLASEEEMELKKIIIQHSAI